MKKRVFFSMNKSRLRVSMCLFVGDVHEHGKMCVDVYCKTPVKMAKNAFFA